MGFLSRLNEVSKPKTFTALFDFGQGDGEETLTFRALSYNDRKRIIADRMVKMGTTDKNGNEKWGLEIPKVGLEFNADLLSATWINPENGKAIATRDALMQWDSDLVDALSKLAQETIGLFKNVEKKEDDENPSKPQS